MLILRLIIRHIRRRRLQSLLFVVGVALGVAVGVAIDLANSSASRAFNLSTESLAGETTHQIIGSSAGFDAQIYSELNAALDIPAAPILEKYVRAVDLAELPLRMVGVDLQAEGYFRNYEAEGELSDSVTLLDMGSILTAKNAVLMSQSLVDRYGLQLGDTLRVRVNTRLESVTIVGLLKPTDSFNTQALDDLLLTDLTTAQALLEMPQLLSRIDLILPPDYDTSQITALLPPQVALTTPARRAEALNQMTAAFELNLQALSLLGLVVGIFLIYNTVMFSVVQRRGVIGIMRALGTSKRQIFALVLGEAFILGTIGTLLGLLLGIIMGQGTVAAVSQSVSDLYFRVNVQTVTLNPATLGRGAVVGIAASLLAAVVPALDATRTTPAGSLRRSDLEQGAAKLVPYVTGGALAMIFIGLVLLWLDSPSIFISFAALFLAVTGAALLTPLGMLVLVRLLLPVSSALFGVLGRMAPRALVRSISRTSVAVAALTLAVSVIVGVGTMITSFRITVVDWLDIILGADIFIATPAGSTDSAPNLDPALLFTIGQVEGVASVASVRNVQLIAPDYPELPPVRTIAVDTDLSHGKREFVWVDSADYFATLQTGKILVTEPFAHHRGITRENNRLKLLTAQGEREFEIFGVYYDYASDQGNILMYQAVYRQYFDDPYVSSIAVLLEPGANLHEVIERIRLDALAGQDLEVQSNRDLKAGAMEVFDRTFSITVALQVLAIIVAFIGILSALMALQLEHVREYGIMRANGMTPNQLRRFTLLQTGLMGAIAGILAQPIGMVLALILVYVINVRSFGWTMNLILSPVDFLQAFAVALLAALVAGIYPAWKVSQVRPAEAIRSE